MGKPEPTALPQSVESNGARVEYCLTRKYHTLGINLVYTDAPEK